MNRIWIAFLFILLASCTPSQTVSDVLLPSNLSVTVSLDSLGLAEVFANAQNANFFSFDFYHPGGPTQIESTDGYASYRFQDSGTYRILVRAHTTHDQYIKTEEYVTISEVPQGGSGISSAGYSTPMDYPGYTLVWNDEFEGNNLSNDWTHEIGRGNNGWGNNELQYYRSENTEVKDGYLIITAKNEGWAGAQYTSSRIITQGRQSFQYGRIDIRAKLPKGQGIWPALWMLGDSFSSVGWPACGEIDIMEMVGGDRPNAGDNYIHGTAHWDNNGQHAQYGGSNKLTSGIYADEFHVFSIIWDASRIQWYRDDILYNELDITSAEMSEFRQKFFFIFNVAVGGNWPGSPNASTEFPQFMAVDYVRVFQK